MNDSKAHLRGKVDMKFTTVILQLALLLFVAGAAHAAIPGQVSYQGLLTDGGGSPTVGPVNMTFRIYDAAVGGTLLWSETQNSVPLTDGVFDVLLGSVTPITIDMTGSRYLETEVDAVIIGARRLMGASPYSLGTSSLADGAGVRSLNGLKDDLRIVGGVNVTVSEAGDSISISATGGTGGIPDSDWDIVGDDMSMIPSGQLGVGTTTPSGKMTVYTENVSGTAMFIEDGGTGTFGLTTFAMKTPNAQGRIEVVDQPSNLRMLVGTTTDDMYMRVSAHEQIELRPGNEISMRLETNGLTKFIAMDDNEGVWIAPQGGIDGGGEIDVNNDAGANVVRMQSNADNGGVLQLFDDGANQALQLTANNEGNAEGGGEIIVYDGSGAPRIRIEAEENGTNGAASTIKLYNSVGTKTIEFDANHNGTDEGRVITQALEITGGADLSEQFSISSEDGEVESGMVVVIDPSRPGDLTLSTRAYDPTVAGVVSGAGGVRTGMLMGQRGSEADGDVPVALTGRVYCWVDASYGAVQPGDLLTTSDTPGHAMRVEDAGRSHGAILGKAMTALTEGRGLVLILVSLQ